MFLKYLKISTPTKTIRKINFRMGINLIVDESEGLITGNSVGKTTVLKLIDFCLGANPKSIYQDSEVKKEVYQLVKDFLINNEILITLCLTKDLNDENAKNIIIERNFLARNKIVRKVNGQKFIGDEFEPKLLELLFPEHKGHKPTFRQIISHNIRHKDISINNTLKTLDSFTTDAEYETLHLFLLGCNFVQGEIKQEILQDIKKEDAFKGRLEKVQTRPAYEAALSLIEGEIEELNYKKTNFNLNKNFESDLEELNHLKFQINRLSNEISNLTIRKDLIIEAQTELASKSSNIDIQQLQMIYSQAKSSMSSIQKSFEELVVYHNQMIDEKIKYITKELPALIAKINNRNSRLHQLLSKENDLSSRISKSDTFEELEVLISALNEKYRNKGEYENIINQLTEVEKTLKKHKSKLKLIDENLFSEEFELVVKTQMNKFNKFFAATSETLYGEKYALKYDIFTNKKGQQLYKFSAFNTSFSSGKKQGEISCFDIAYTLFADNEKLSCLHFLLNDKKELMHDNQLVKISEMVNNENIQFVASILRDKLPQELNDEKYFIVKLSENDKLFRIESH